MRPIKGYCGKVASQKDDLVTFSDGSKFKTRKAPPDIIGKIVMIDTHGKWWVMHNG